MSKILKKIFPQREYVQFGQILKRFDQPILSYSPLKKKLVQKTCIPVHRNYQKNQGGSYTQCLMLLTSIEIRSNTKINPIIMGKSNTNNNG